MSHPAQIVADAVGALNREDWNAFVGLCDPVSVRRFKRDLVWQLTDRGPGDPVSVDDFLREMPDMPREVAEYNLAEIERSRDPILRLHLEISTVSSFEELTSLEADQVLLRWLQSRMPRREEEFSTRRWQPADGLEVVELRRLSEEEIDCGAISKPEYVVLGSVRDGDEFAHVVCRHVLRGWDDCEVEGDDLATPQDELELERALRDRKWIHTAACRKQADGSWRLVVDRGLFFMANMSIAAPGID